MNCVIAKLCEVGKVFSMYLCICVGVGVFVSMAWVAGDLPASKISSVYLNLNQ